MQAQTSYTDVVTEVCEFLQGQRQVLNAAGVADARIVLDPGIGFGKTPAQNIALQRGQAELMALGLPVLVGWSRKSTLGVITGRAVEDRLAASLAAALSGVASGARVVRVHDVRATVDALKVWQALHQV